ncbi:hypothetical protein HMI54_009338 [Coelomomyces lativittatus]|nr:hypothetical protein HMI55_001301 [Coelomomyces lativittatus]KAJ1511298.1 hypothetical protein HMI56_005573 [Coelomomyces lativittatus]KAJ1516467.1 hypothetical protein HMI54_009338 [Coelomomyces lativittatus]
MHWRERDEKSKKRGVHAPIRFTNGDVYIGDWVDNLRHGRGTLESKTEIYQGMWQNDRRYGFGTLILKGKGKVYSGDWCQDQRHGIGTAFMSDGSRYEGGWSNNQRSGWGTMFYKDGSRYDGEWFEDQRHGQGVLLLPNQDRYEGIFVRDKKEGPGKFYYKSKKKIYIGEWSEDMPKCGTLNDIGNGKIPILELVDGDSVLLARKMELTQERVQRLLMEGQTPS